MEGKELLDPRIILLETLIRIDREIPEWIKTRVVDEIPADCQSFSYELEIDDEDRKFSLDQFSERYLAPMVAMFINQLGDIRAAAGADKEILFFKIELGQSDIWSEMASTRKVSMRLRKRFFGDVAHFDIAYAVGKINRAVAA